MLAGVLQGAIDYYILDKIQRLTNTKAFTKVRQQLRCKHAWLKADQIVICEGSVSNRSTATFESMSPLDSSVIMT